jgi:hypothetical protein
MKILTAENHENIGQEIDERKSRKQVENVSENELFVQKMTYYYKSG